MLWLVLFFLAGGFVAKEEEDEVCFNGCSGHGRCWKFMCSCDVGWTGDDCRYAVVPELAQEKMLPVLSGGHFNVTAKNLTTVIRKVKYLLVGFSASSCLKCIGVESEYANASDELRRLKVAFARADADVESLRSILTEVGALGLPSILVYAQQRLRGVYKGRHSAEALTTYAQKITTPLQKLQSIDEIKNFLKTTEEKRRFILGIFRSEIDESDEIFDFKEAADHFAFSEDAYFAFVVDPILSRACVATLKLADATPAIVLQKNAEPRRRSVSSYSLGDQSKSLSDWINEVSLPLVGELTTSNFAQYEKLGKPMLLLFLDLPKDKTEDSRVVPGQTGGLYNEALVEELRSVARDESFAERVAFAYCDGRLHASRARALGLFGGLNRLPGLAFNTKEPGIIAAYPENLPLSREPVRAFVAAFLSRTLRTKEDADKFALAEIKNRPSEGLLPRRKPMARAPPERVGVSEQFGSESLGVEARGRPDRVVELTVSNFESLAINDDSKDVMILFHATDCGKPCAAMTVYYKKVADRFHDLAISSLLVARFDATRTLPPLNQGWLTNAQLPLLLFLPANNKDPPFRAYSGISKVQPIMRWAQDSASIPFDLPDLCHLSDHERILYKEQVTELSRRQ